MVRQLKVQEPACNLDLIFDLMSVTCIARNLFPVEMAAEDRNSIPGVERKATSTEIGCLPHGGGPWKRPAARVPFPSVLALVSRKMSLYFFTERG